MAKLGPGHPQGQEQGQLGRTGMWLPVFWLPASALHSSTSPSGVDFIGKTAGTHQEKVSERGSEGRGRGGRSQPPLLHDVLVGGVGRSFDDLQAGGAAAASASGLAAAFAAPSVVPAAAAPITTSTAGSVGRAAAVGRTAAGTSRAKAAAASRAKGHLAVVHSCRGTGQPSRGQKD